MTQPFLSNTNPPWQQLKLSKHELKELKDQWSLLHLLHHRSKNQHRHSSWYRCFNMFRKQLRLIIDELDPQLPTDALPSQSAKVFEQSVQKIVKRLDFWADVMVLKWNQAFRQLITDRQFAVIGLTLLATLGRTVKVLDVLPKMKKADNVALADSFDDVAKPSRIAKLNAGDSLDDLQTFDNDIGLAIERDASDDDILDLSATEDRSVESRILAHDQSLKTEKADASSRTRSQQKPPRKRKKGGDEIDDLFSGLL